MSVSINIEWLYSFITLAKTGNFVSAANELFMTSQSLSYQIKKLEKHLNIKLIERGNKNNELTFAGHILLEKASILIKNFENEVTTINTDEKPILKLIQTTDCNFDYLIAQSIIDFHQSDPNTKIKIYSVFNDDLEQVMLKETINLALTTKELKNTNKFVSTLIAKIPFVIVSKDSKNWDELKYLSPNYHPSRKLKNKELMEDTYNLEVFSDVPSLTPAIELCKRGLGAMYVPFSSIESEINKNKLQIIESNIEPEFISFYAITRKNRTLSTIDKLFLSLIKKNISSSEEHILITTV